MRGRHILHILLFILLFPIVFSSPLIDYSKSYSIPKVIEPNSDATVFIYLTSTNYVSDVDVKITPSNSCIEIPDDNFELSYLTKGEYKMLPVEISIKDCKYDVYWLNIDIEYIDNGTRKENMLKYPITVTAIPDILITSMDIIPDPALAGYPVKVKLKIKNNGKVDVYNVKLNFNSTQCAIPRLNEIYVGNIKKGEEKSIEVTLNIPKDVYTTTCNSYFTVSYETWDKAKYFNSNQISFEVKNVRSGIIIYNYTFVPEILSPLEEGNLKVCIKNTNSDKYYNIEVSIYSEDLDFVLTKKTVEKISPLSIACLDFNLYVPEDVDEGIRKLPVVITYQDSSGRVYNLTEKLIYKIGGKARLTVLQSIEPHKLEIANLGPVTAKNIIISFEINGRKYSEYIDELEPGDKMELRVYIPSYHGKLKVDISWEDKLGNKYEETQEVYLEISGVNILYIVLGMILIVLGTFYFFRKRKK